MFGRYVVVSVVALVVDAAVLAMAVRLLGMPPGVGSGVGYAFGALVHYRLSRRHVFSSSWLRHTPLIEFAAFIASGACGLVVTMAVVHLLSAMLGFGLVLAKASAVVVSFVTVYRLRASVVFRAASRGTLNRRADEAAATAAAKDN